jgi:putative ABC transport system permease protein
VVVITARPKKGTNIPLNVTFRGVTPIAFNVRNNIKVVEGRSFTPGLYEVIVGKKIADRVSGVDIGSTISIQRKNWKVVGLFAADDSSFESEIWGDYDAMAPAIGRNGGCESLTVRLTNPSVLASLDKDLRANPQMQVQADSERKYYENLAGSIGTALIILASFVAIVMGIGAVFGAMNTMYAIVSQRTREIGTLRALGFSRFSILISFVMESVLLALVGGVVGCLIALPMNGFTAATGTNSFSELAFAFKVTPDLLMIGLGFAVIMGFVGGLLPAFRAARMPITRALREA